MTTITPLQLLYNTESLLRRHLQATTIDNNGDTTMYTQTTEVEDSQSRGRTVLTILYLCVLGLCFVVPVFYYFRLHCFEEHARRELELDFSTALEASEQHREESRAARRKYIEERRARIVQLLGPVRMVLKEENFPHLVDPNKSPQRSGSFINLDFESEKYAVPSGDESATMASEADVLPPYTSDGDDDGEELGETTTTTMEDKANRKSQSTQKTVASNEEEEERGGTGFIETKCGYDEEIEADDDDSKEADDDDPQKSKDLQHNPYGDEDTFFIRIPVAGLPLGGSCFLDPTRPQRQPDQCDDREMRLAPGLCTICLSNYKVGADIVWSSNENCDHHFHANCIEKWLMKQREGPLCPICRRDFVVDPLDLFEEEGENNNNNNHIQLAISGSTDEDDDQGHVITDVQPIMFRWNPNDNSMEDVELGNLVVMVAAEVAAAEPADGDNNNQDPIPSPSSEEEEDLSHSPTTAVLPSGDMAITIEDDDEIETNREGASTGNAPNNEASSSGGAEDSGTTATAENDVQV